MTHETQLVDESEGEDTQRAKKPKAEASPKKTEKRKTYPCPYSNCQRVLLTRPGLDYHILVHANSKPYACKSCDAKYRCNQELEKHTARAHWKPAAK